MANVQDTHTRGARARQLLNEERFRWWLAFVLLTMLAAVRAAYPSERDIYWSARAGLENLAGDPIARPDTWSWSAEGVWYPNSPAWNVILGLGWQGMGFWGLFWASFLAMAVFFGLALVAARSVGARAIPTVVVFIPLLLASSAALSGRATIVVQSMLLLSALFAWWWGGRMGHVPPFLAGLVVGIAGFVMSFAGNWIHLSFMLIAGAIAVMWAFAWWFSPSIRLGRRVSITLAGTAGLFLGCVFSPYGIELTLERSRIVQEICEGIIIEWTSLVSAVGYGELRWLVIAAVALAAAFGTSVWVVRQVRRGDRFSPTMRLAVPLAIFSIPVTLIGVGALRFLAVGMLAMLPIAAAAATALIRRIHLHQAQHQDFWSRPKLVEYASARFWTVILVGMTLVLTPIAALTIARGAKPAEAELAQHLPGGCLMISDAGSAGPVILSRTDVKVWIDGRADFYGRDHLIGWQRISLGLDPVPADANCAVMPIALIGRQYPLVDVLDSDPTWVRVEEYDGFALWVRS